MSYETRYAAHVRQKADAVASTPEAAIARAKLQDALDRAGADVRARFPVITADAFDYQNERIAYWRRVLKA